MNDFSKQKPNLENPLNGKQYAANFFSYLDFCRTLAEGEEMKQYVTLTFDELSVNMDDNGSLFEDNKPTDSYALMIYKALEFSYDGKLTLAEIYTWIETNYPYYQTADIVWRNSIRHNLSLNPTFKKIPRPSDSKGKGGFWAIDQAHRQGKLMKNRRQATSDSHSPTGMFSMNAGKMVF
ncbi:forkhead box protein J2-like [Arctopsyche grandis]|uniref:forkhead box protein J2-like n=1 Tax=Arctopsyche grandis TaxID=121162 RepID=UPI00406D6877